mmetsp:Transcript_15716/g.45968  ORF Transcript_15716/g.45968 Transcript_15716/m.45968 type:complete len:256 (+) Transcript_15716:251-1018(+)
MELSSSSIALCSRSTSADRAVRTCSLVASSESHQPLCEASSLASSMRRMMRSLTIFFTLAKGSSRTRTARAERMRLLIFSARRSRNAATRCCAGLCPLESSCISEALRPWPPCTRDVARYLSETARTWLLERISMACSMAAISSVRSFWRSSKSASFCLQLAVVSVRYFVSPAFVAVTSSSSPFQVAASWRFFAFSWTFSETAASAVVLDFFRSWTSSSCAWRVFISSFSSAERSSMNFSFSFWRMSRTPADRNS